MRPDSHTPRSRGEYSPAIGVNEHVSPARTNNVSPFFPSVLLAHKHGLCDMVARVGHDDRQTGCLCVRGRVQGSIT